MTEGGDDESDSCVLVQSLFVNFMWSSRVLQVAEADDKSGDKNAVTTKPSTTTTAKPTGSASGSPAALTLLVAPLLLSTVLLHGWSG